VSDERGAPKKPVSAERPVASPAAPARAASIEKLQPPQVDGHFSPPTVDNRPKFQSPVVSAPAAPPGPPQQPLSLHGEMAKAATKLSTANRAAQRMRSAPVLAGVAVLVIISGLLLVMSLGARTPKPTNLLDEVQRNEKALAAGAGVVASATAARTPPANATAALAPPSAPFSAVTGFQWPAAPAVKTRAAPQNRDIRERDDEIASEFGRPTIPTGMKGKPSGAQGRTTAAAPTKPKPEQPSWLQVATPQEPAAKAAGAVTAAAGTLAPAPRYGVPTGAHIRARLQTNLDSRTVGSGPVEATLMRPFLANGKAIFPSRTMLYGAAQTSGARFTIRFTRVRLPDDTEIQFEGLAYDTAERKPGLPGRVVGAPVVQSGNNTGGKVAAAVASTALGAVGGDLAHDAAREAGQVVLRDATNSEGQVGSGSALLLDAGQDFDVFVSKPF
jgi:type IV secretory pathway VirB10-like protein